MASYRGDGPQSEGAKDIVRNFYTIDWLDDCYRQLSVPNPLMEKLIEKVGDRLAPMIKDQMSESSIKQQTLLLLLGPQYRKQHFPSQKFDPKLLEPPRLSPEVKLATIDDVRNWLMQQVYITSQELGFNRSISTGSAPVELEEFQQQMQTVYKAALDERVKQLEINPKVRSHPNSSLMDDSRSRAMGEALLAVGIRDPFEMAHILKSLQTKCYPLPGTLRSYVWREFLFLRQGVKDSILLTNVSVEKQTYFRSTAQRNSEEFKQVSPLECRIHSQIKDAVMEIYNSSSAMRKLGDDGHMLEAVKVLNALYSYNQMFNPLFVYWLCPLQLALDRKDYDEDTWLYHLAFHFEFFVPECPLSLSELFTTADHVLETLKGVDPFLHEYLDDASGQQVIANAKDFPEECYHLNPSEAKKMMSVLEDAGGEEVPSPYSSAIGHPAIFIRKWLATVFVGVLSPPALLILWDLIFMGKWDRRRLGDFCLVILGLLKSRFYEAKHFRAIQQVFFEDGNQLLTNDIRRAWLHWQNQGAFDAIPAMNRTSRMA